METPSPCTFSFSFILTEAFLLGSFTPFLCTPHCENSSVCLLMPCLSALPVPERPGVVTYTQKGRSLLVTYRPKQLCWCLRSSISHPKDRVLEKQKQTNIFGLLLLPFPWWDSVGMNTDPMPPPLFFVFLEMTLVARLWLLTLGQAAC